MVAPSPPTPWKCLGRALENYANEYRPPVTVGHPQEKGAAGTKRMLGQSGTPAGAPGWRAPPLSTMSFIYCLHFYLFAVFSSLFYSYIFLSFSNEGCRWGDQFFVAFSASSSVRGGVLGPSQCGWTAARNVQLSSASASLWWGRQKHTCWRFRRNGIFRFCSSRRRRHRRRHNSSFNFNFRDRNLVFMFCLFLFRFVGVCFCIFSSSLFSLFVSKEIQKRKKDRTKTTTTGCSTICRS